MKSVLISIQPKWCELIANRKKTVEVRKTRPKIDVPFKCYIYMTKAYDTIFGKGKPKRVCIGGGKVIGEFICDSIIADKSFGHNALFKTSACMSDADISAYCLNDEMYGWHISDLVIYDKPRELSEFRYYNPIVKLEGGYPIPIHEIERPPQSWCYVETDGGSNA